MTERRDCPQCPHLVHWGPCRVVVHEDGDGRWVCACGGIHQDDTD